MTPMIRRDGGRIDPEGFDGVDDFQGALDPRPAIQLQQGFGTGMHETERLEGLGAEDSAQDDEPHGDGSMLVSGPADAGKDCTGGETNPSSLPIDHLFPARVREITFLGNRCRMSFELNHLPGHALTAEVGSQDLPRLGTPDIVVALPPASLQVFA